MKRLVFMLSLTAVVQFSPAYGQLAPGNEFGLSLGHLHLAAPDREKEAKAWIALGGQLESNFSANIPIGFPGIVILLGQSRPVKGGSEGSLIDHVGFRVPNLEASLTKWKGVETWWKEGNWGLKIQPGTKPGQAFVTTPAGTKCEILEDKSLKVPIAFDHVHYYIPESRIQEEEDYYQKMFGAMPVKGEPDTLSMPGGKLVFTKSDTPRAATTGRSLNHIGFNMLNADVLKAFAATLEAKGAHPTYESSSMGMARVIDPLGIPVEITKAQGGYFDTKLLDKTWYQVDEGGKKEGETPSHPR